MATYGFDENKNKIEVPPKTETGMLSSLRTTDKSSLVAAVNECFQNASDGKNKIAAAIGDGATASMSWDTLASKIYKKRVFSLENGSLRVSYRYVDDGRTWYEAKTNTITCGSSIVVIKAEIKETQYSFSSYYYFHQWEGNKGGDNNWLIADGNQFYLRESIGSYDYDHGNRIDVMKATVLYI